MKRLVLASSNAGKLAELQPLLAGAGYELLRQGELGVSDAIEDGRTFVENALIKARHACLGTGLPALADDSGIVVDALDGAPGLLSARYAGAHGDSGANNRKLLAALQGLPESKRSARFVAVLVLLRHADDPLPLVAQGVWEGRILDAPRGENGFGYDPLFFDPLLGRGAAELEPELKNRVSHRGQALVKLRELLGC
jgi:XTP/dITP diphosphohydrolase